MLYAILKIALGKTGFITWTFNKVQISELKNWKHDAEKMEQDKHSRTWNLYQKKDKVYDSRGNKWQ